MFCQTLRRVFINIIHSVIKSGSVPRSRRTICADMENRGPWNKDVKTVEFKMYAKNNVLKEYEELFVWK